MLRCLIASLANALWTGSCSLLVVMPRQLSSVLLVSGTVPLTPTVTTCTVPTTFHPASLRADTSGAYFALFLLTALLDCRSEVQASSPMRTLTALRAPSGDVQCETGPPGGSTVSGHPSSTTMSGCTPPVGGPFGCAPPEGGSSGRAPSAGGPLRCTPLAGGSPAPGCTPPVGGSPGRAPPVGGSPGCAPPAGGSPPPAASPSVLAAPGSLRSVALAAGGSIQSGIVCCSPWPSTLPKLVR
eukprot:881652-Pyramimonas_sp.AAC.1